MRDAIYAASRDDSSMANPFSAYPNLIRFVQSLRPLSDRSSGRSRSSYPSRALLKVRKNNPLAKAKLATAPRPYAIQPCIVMCTPSSPHIQTKPAPVKRSAIMATIERKTNWDIGWIWHTLFLCPAAVLSHDERARRGLGNLLFTGQARHLCCGRVRVLSELGVQRPSLIVDIIHFS